MKKSVNTVSKSVKKINVPKNNQSQFVRSGKSKEPLPDLEEIRRILRIEKEEKSIVGREKNISKDDKKIVETKLRGKNKRNMNFEDEHILTLNDILKGDVDDNIYIPRVYYSKKKWYSKAIIKEKPKKEIKKDEKQKKKEEVKIPRVNIEKEIEDKTIEKRLPNAEFDIKGPNINVDGDIKTKGGKVDLNKPNLDLDPVNLRGLLSGDIDDDIKLKNHNMKFNFNTPNFDHLKTVFPQSSNIIPSSKPKLTNPPKKITKSSNDDQFDIDKALSHFKPSDTYIRPAMIIDNTKNASRISSVRRHEVAVGNIQGPNIAGGIEFSKPSFESKESNNNMKNKNINNKPSNNINSEININLNAENERIIKKNTLKRIKTVKNNFNKLPTFKETINENKNKPIPRIVERKRPFIFNLEKLKAYNVPKGVYAGKKKKK